MEALLKRFLNIDWRLQVLLVAGGATLIAIAIALSVAIPLYEHLTGLAPTQGFVDTVLITASFTAIVVAFPIVSVFVTMSEMLKSNEEIAHVAEEVAVRKNDIFESLLDSSVAMQRTDKLVELIDGMLSRLEGLLPGSQLGIIVDSGRPQMVRSFTSRDISDNEKQFLLENNGILLGEVPHQQWVKQRFNRYADWAIFPMQGRGGVTVGKLVVKGGNIGDDDEEILRIFLEQLTAATENKLLTIELEKLANTDQLSGLYSRNYFQMELARQIELKKESAISDFSIILIDINGLKKVNDSIGHVAGDALITHAADLLKASCRKEDWVCRVGGDEFVIICPGTNSKQAQKVVDRVVEGCKDAEIDVKNNKDEPMSIPMRMSVGLACSAEVNTNKVYALADERMYVDKKRFYAEQAAKEEA